MLDEKDLQALKEMMNSMEQRMDQKLEAMEQRLDQKFVAMEQSTDEKLMAMEQRTDDKLMAMEQRIKKDTVILMDAEFSKRFDLLAEGIQVIQEKMVPLSRVEVLEEEVKFLKTVIRQMCEDIQNLKKAQ